MQKEPMRFGDFIRQKRLERELLQSDVAKALGVSVSFVSEMERRCRLPFDSPKMERFAEYLDLTEDEKAQMYDLASRESREVPADIETILMYEEVGDMARFALRQSKAGDLTEEDWKQLIRKGEENKSRRKGGAKE